MRFKRIIGIRRPGSQIASIGAKTIQAIWPRKLRWWCYPPHTSWRPGRHIDKGVEGPNVKNLHYPYTASGKKAAAAARRKAKKKSKPTP